MSVLDRGYRRWEGQPTPYWARILVIPRHAIGDVFQRRAVVAFYVACFTPPLALAVAVYAAANLDKLLPLVPGLQVLERLGATGVPPSWYGRVTVTQLWLAGAWTLLAGPRLVARDLAHGALPLYFSKALRRVDYMAGKWLTLVAVLSSVTWLPLLVVAGLQWSLAPEGWWRENGWFLPSVLGTCAVAISLFTTLVTALSAHVRRETFAQAAFVVTSVVASGFATWLAAVTGSSLAWIVSPTHLLYALHAWAFRAPDPAAPSTAIVMLGLAGWIGGCVALLARKIRPVEVVR